MHGVPGGGPGTGDPGAGASEMVWWGWGRPGPRPRLSARAAAVLDRLVGLGEPSAPVPLAGVAVPGSRLPAAAAARLTAVVGAEHLSTDAADRVRSAGGRSYPDLVRLRRGDAGTAPDAVVAPADHAQVAAVLAVCADEEMAVVPHGGGTSVVGGVGARPDGFAAVVALSTARMHGLVDVDPLSQIARFRPGTRGPEVEELLAGAGLTLGHVPQSHEFATLGGYVATRSAGQTSPGHGRIDDLVVALTCATPVGDLVIGPAPSGAGPDLRRLLLGSEGTLGVLTEIGVRVRPAPRERRYEAWLFPSFAAGVDALRTATQAGEVPDLARLSDPDETATTLALSAASRPLAAYARARGVAGGAMAVLGWEGDPATVRRRRRAILRRLRGTGGVYAGRTPGRAWEGSRFDAGYLRDDMLDRGLFVDTLETAATWSRLPTVHAGAREAIAGALARRGTPPLVGCHVSHVYPTGASLYFTVIAHAEQADALGQWEALKRDATDAIVAAGGAVTHHHAVGRDHARWYAESLGGAGVAALQGAKDRLDPAGIMNPGVLLPPRP